MKKFGYYKKLIPLIGCAVFVGLSFITVSCSCSKKDPEPNPEPNPEPPITTDYNTEGTNWQGFSTGTLTLECIIGEGQTIGTAIITGNNSYVAIDLVIPDYVTDGTNIYRLTGIGSSVFEDSTGLTGSLTIGNEVESIGEKAFEYCHGFNGTLTIGNKVKYIKDEAFKQCTTFTGDLIIPDSVIAIGNYAFERPSNTYNSFFGGLTIGNSVETIGNYAFSSTNATYSKFSGNLTIPDSVTSIGDYAFQRASFLDATLTIGNHVTSVGIQAFVWDSFNELIFPNSLIQNVGNEAFNKCLKIGYIRGYYDTLPTWPYSVFGGFNPVLPTGVVINYGSLSSADFCDFLHSKGLPNTYTT